MSNYNVTYLLGAGFSAPLGIPVMKEFVNYSKKIYRENKAELKHFKEVFELWEKASTIKNYFDIDLFNVEEFLSLLEISSYVKNENHGPNFKRYLADVVKHGFPSQLWKPIQFEYDNLDTFRHLFLDSKYLDYFLFISSLGNGIVNWYSEIKEARLNKSLHHVKYSVVTLNYDCVIEENLRLFPTIFRIKDGSHPKFDYIKIHGSAEFPDSIIPPTWNKLLYPERQQQWQKAFSMLSDAHEIRIIGYSLPQSDNYFRYFLMDAIRSNEHLDSIQIICRDPDKVVEQRFRSFLKEYRNNYIFKSQSTEGYLHTLKFRTLNSNTEFPMSFFLNRIEVGNNEFFGQPINKNILNVNW